MRAELLFEADNAQGASAIAAQAPWVERKRDLSVAEFVRDHLRPRRPVVLVNALRDWPALGKFTHEYFRREYPDLPVQVRGQPHRLADVLDLQMASSAQRPGPYPCTLSATADLLADLTPRFACSLPTRAGSRLIPKSIFGLINHMEIFFGGPGGGFPRVHCDMLHLHAWITQAQGEKEVTVYEHGQEHLLYVNPDLPWLSAIQDPHDHDRYPLLRQARAHHVVLRPGDALFMPQGTWHTARCLGMNITVAFDQLEPTNWRAFVRDVAAEQRRNGRPLKGLLFGAYLRALGPLFDAMEMLGAHKRTDWRS